MRCDKTDETDDAGNGNACTRYQRNADDQQNLLACDVESKRMGCLLAKRQRVQHRPTPENERGAESDRRKRDGDMREGPVGERAEQPERDFQRCEIIGRKIERQRDERGTEGRHGQPGEHDGQYARVAPGRGKNTCDGEQAAQDRGNRQQPGKCIGGARRQHDDGTERGRVARTDEIGRGQRIAQEPLQARAGQSEAAADDERKQCPWQSEFEKDDARGLVAARDPAE